MWRLVNTVIEEQKQKPARAQDNYLANLLNDPEITNPLLIRDVLVTLLFAGRDNTQNALAWALYALMNNPQWISRMREEAVANASESHEVEYHDLAVRVFVPLLDTSRSWDGIAVPCPSCRLLRGRAAVARSAQELPARAGRRRAPGDPASWAARCEG